MSETLRKPAPEAHTPVGVTLSVLAPPVLPAEVNDNSIASAERRGESCGFQIPAAMWTTMIGCYAMFLAALLVATGDGYAAFAIAISAVYVIMFFGTAAALLRQAPKQARSPLLRADGKLQTLYGPLGRGEVMAQMLVVPGAIAVFGLAVLAIRILVA